MQARDLQEWAESPEAFHHETEAGAWEEHPRACAERLLMTLVKVQGTTPACQGAVGCAWLLTACTCEDTMCPALQCLAHVWQ